MEKRYSKKLGLTVSCLGFGTMRLPLLQGSNTAVDQKLVELMVDRAMQAGVNYFDTAFTYHNGISELLVGRILQKYSRENFYLANKMPLWSLKSTDDAERIFASQLKKCRVDYFDFYLLHGLNSKLYTQALSLGLYQWLCEKKAMGLIRHVGFSFHDTPELLQCIVDSHAWDFAQIQLNYVDWEIGGAGKLYDILGERNIPTIVMEPVRGGALADLPPKAAALLKQASPDASTASWALRYVASLPHVMTVLSGMSSLEQMEDNITTLSYFKKLSPAERDIINEVTAIYLASGDIPCTGCKYCIKCPQEIDIAAIFSAYNHRNRGNFNLLYPAIPENAQAHNCLVCGDCMQYCPQHINIPEKLQDVLTYLSHP